MPRRIAVGVLQTTSRLLQSGMLKQHPPWMFPVAMNTPPGYWLRDRPRTEKEKEMELDYYGKKSTQSNAQRYDDKESELMRTASDATVGKDPSSYEKFYQEQKDLRLTTRKDSFNDPARKSKTPSMNKPSLEKIVWPEDAIRERFWKDHPWELFRDHYVLEGNDVVDSRPLGLSSSSSSRISIDAALKAAIHLREWTRHPKGEDAIQFALHLHIDHDYSLPHAYRSAVMQFRDLRSTQSITIQYAALEALAYGTVFHKSEIDRGIRVEESYLDKWDQDSNESSNSPEDNRRPKVDFLSFQNDSSMSPSDTVDISSTVRWPFGSGQSRQTKHKYYTDVDESELAARTFNSGLDYLGASSTFGTYKS